VPAAVGDDVYATGASLRRIGLRDGAVRGEWRPDDAPEDFQLDGTPVVLEDRVIAHGTGGIYALDRPLGKLLWHREIETPRFSAACESGLYVVPGGGGVAALDVADGSTRWTFTREPALQVNLSPAIDSGRVFFGSWDGTFFALDLQDGSPVWTFQGNEAFGWTDPVVAFGKVFVGDRGGVVHALDAATGKEVWRRVSGATGLSEPGIFPGNVLVGFGRVVSTMNEATGIADGRLFRTGLNPFGSPTLIGDTLYFGNLDGNLYAFDYRTEDLLWRFAVGEDHQVGDFVCHDGVILVSTNAELFALANDPDAERGEEPFTLRP
jgi:outer membrane protein assembly factor BamB